MDRLDRIKDAVVLAVAIVGVIYLFGMETIGANARMALTEPFNGNSAAVLTMVTSLIGSVTGWNRGKAVPAARKANGLPSVDPVRLVQHDVFNLVVLPILMVLNFGVWLDLVDAYVYTILFSCYMLSDAAYIWTYPEAVPQPSLVLAHHSFVLALLSHPLRTPANAIFTAVRTVFGLHTHRAFVRMPCCRCRGRLVTRQRGRTCCFPECCSCGGQHNHSRWPPAFCEMALGRHHVPQGFPVRSSCSKLRALATFAALASRRECCRFDTSDRGCRAFNEVVYWTTYFGIRFGVHPWMVLVASRTVPEPFFERILIVRCYTTVST